MERREETAIIKITKVFYDNQPTHWECDVFDFTGQEIGGGTGPTFAGIHDLSYDVIVGGKDYYDEINEWTAFDANKR